ncbi:MAG: hypothetical protein D6686_06805 [Alphaproteobacteria bacterium]|nr:MAG: hypothetical protein D6686_06805 [Alphaproteobacteria bacterium]
MKKKDLVERVVERAGLRKGEARKAVDAALAVIRETLESGTDVTLPPLGRIKVKTRGEGAEATTHYKLVLTREKEEEAEQA